MFHTIASLLLFGALSPIGTSQAASPDAALLQVTPPPAVSSLLVSSSFSASGAIVVDALSGQAVFGRRADEPRAVGSLVKLMTAILILENHGLEEMVTIPRGAADVGGSIAGLSPGDRYTVGSLLAAMLVSSANDAAYALAVEHSDTLDRFVEEMNERARSMGLQKTHFTNPIGFDHPAQVSTPRELAWLSMYALKDDVIRTYTSRRSVTIHDQSGGSELTLFSTNRLLSSHPSDFFGLKTGTTAAAGECLISLAYAGGRPYLFVVLRSTDRYEDTLKLFESLTAEKA